ncbi:MAG: helix-turn-helix domain-containing protein [Bdellovibrionales bacterium]|nr:helix-turn-helix domain-containing protein [Bdellovibrionales bacterium]
MAVVAGIKQHAVAAALGVSPRTLRKWLHSYRRGGARGLKRRPIPGRPSRLSPAEARRLTRLLKRNPRALGFPTDRWTRLTLRELIFREFNACYRIDHIPHLIIRITGKKVSQLP